MLSLILYGVLPTAVTILVIRCRGTRLILRSLWIGRQRCPNPDRVNPADGLVVPKRASFTDEGRSDATKSAWLPWRQGCGGNGALNLAKSAAEVAATVMVWP